MASDYLYGTQAKLGASVVKASKSLGRICTAVGTAPVNLVRGYKEKGLVNKPVKLTAATGKNTIGYSKNWKHFTLSEVIGAFFSNTKGNVEPLYVINVLDPDANKKEEATTKTLNFVNGQASFLSDTIILDTFAIAEKAEGVDYTLDYNYNTGAVIVDSNSAAVKLNGTVECSYSEIDLAFLNTDESAAAALIGGTTSAGIRTGLDVLEEVYNKYFVITNYLIAPGFTHIPAVRNAMAAKVQKFNDMWDAVFYSDIPTDEDAENVIDTREKAIAWKVENNYKSEREKTCWPKAKDSGGNVYHLSTLYAVEQLRIDQENNCVPYETAANKSVDLVSSPYVSAEITPAGFTRGEANQLTQNGISTLLPWEGVYKLWGHHTSAYTYGGTYDARAVFDTSINMLLYLMNSFTKDHAEEIDKPMKLSLKQDIEDAENKKLRELVAVGALLEDPEGESPVFRFEPANNPSGDILEGHFRWDLGATPTPPFASGTAIVAFTDAGFNAYLQTE